MERGIELIGLKDATEPIPDFGGDSVDPHQMIQVHDYKTISIFRMDPHVKAASRATIQTFRDYYPELLCDKYFTNTPWLFQSIFNAFKAIIPVQTFKKFHIVANGAEINRHISEEVPAIYGGKGGSLEDSAETVKFQGKSSQLVVDANTAPLKSPAQESFVSAQEHHTQEAVPADTTAPAVKKPVKKAEEEAKVSEPESTPAEPAPPATEKAAEPPAAELAAVKLDNEKSEISTESTKPAEVAAQDPEKAAASADKLAQSTTVQA